ncbi:DNA-directed RNA polymerase subunit beta [Oceanobacillus kapialis]|uniref:DNA-directed RNA polymerase subunit beta n=1 Tax=Oceanobacillus kapialis TaxID=481353 RepID=A0ABW5Q1J3_9BACI
MSTEQEAKQGMEQQTRKAYKTGKKSEPTAEKNESKQSRKKQKAEKKSAKQKKKARLRIFPIWLRIIVVLLFATIALVAGLMVGYGVIGDGSPLDALKVETWQHIIDIVTKTE